MKGAGWGGGERSHLHAADSHLGLLVCVGGSIPYTCGWLQCTSVPTQRTSLFAPFPPAQL